MVEFFAESPYKRVCINYIGLQCVVSIIKRHLIGLQCAVSIIK
jgi:hypothetical protein